MVAGMVATLGIQEVRLTLPLLQGGRSAVVVRERTFTSRSPKASDTEQGFGL